MATHYLYGTVLTGEAVAANNRGENIGNTTTLQKVFHHDDLHTSVSAEAIRFAIRYRFQLQGLSVNRSYNGSLGTLSFEDEKRVGWNSVNAAFIDDDLMGFMDAAAAKNEREDEDATGLDEADMKETETDMSSDAKKLGQAISDKSAGKEQAQRSAKGKQKAKGKTTKRPSPLAIGRAVSLRPYRGELSFNAVSGEKEKGKLSLYSAEMHTTEYQYSFGINLDDVVNKRNIGELVDAIVDPPAVAGNHARFAYDFSPASIVLRFTGAHSSRIQNCFEHDEVQRTYSVNGLVARVESGDVPGSELIIGGELASTPAGKKLKTLGADVHAGVLAAANAARKKIALLGNAYGDVAPETPTEAAR